MLLARELAEQVIGLAIGVHLVAGPGLLESVDEACLCDEPEQAGIPFDRQARSPVCYKNIQLDEGFPADSLADRQLPLEIEAAAALAPAHDAQMLTYLRMSGLRDGLMFNFHEPLQKDGMRRCVV